MEGQQITDEKTHKKGGTYQKKKNKQTKQNKTKTKTIKWFQDNLWSEIVDTVSNPPMPITLYFWATLMIIQ